MVITVKVCNKTCRKLNVPKSIQSNTNLIFFFIYEENNTIMKTFLFRLRFQYVFDQFCYL